MVEKANVAPAAKAANVGALTGVADVTSVAPATLGWHDARYPYKVTLSRVIPELTAFDGNFPTRVEFTPQGQYELTYKVVLSPEDFAKVVAE